MWYTENVFYQIYTLGFCGAPLQNAPVADSPAGDIEPRIRQVEKCIPYYKELGIGTVLFNPVFESDAHGYDTRDYRTLDCRLGRNEDFAAVCDALHSAGIRVILDGVFNHVGRGFWAFQDVLRNKWESPYKEWFFIDFSRDSNYGDGFWYDGWEGHYDLVKLNLQNPQVASHLLDSVGQWIEQFHIDGIRLDVAYCLDPGFIESLRNYVDSRKEEFFLVGEMLHGDYKALVRPGMLDSATNYECFKGMYSSLNSMNFFEIGYSLNRQFGPEGWTLYKGLPLMAFVDNHDVTRAATVLQNKKHLPLLYGMLFGMPGIPCLYYGSEWGAEGDKAQGDAMLRPAFDKPVENELSALIKQMCKARVHSDALCHGDYLQVYLTNHQFVFQRKTDKERYLIALNAADEDHTVHFDAGAGMAIDKLTGEKVDFGGGLQLSPLSVLFLEMER